jgi:iron complex transport system substrate-binding protein
MRTPLMLIAAIVAATIVAAQATSRDVTTGGRMAVSRSAVAMGGPAYPRHVTGLDGARIAVPRPARRIVSQEWSLDEYLAAIVPPDRIVGVSRAAFDPEYSNVLDLVQRMRPRIAEDVEGVVAMHPDLVLVSTTARADYTDLLRATGTAVVRLDTEPATLASVEEQMRAVGYLAGEDARAAAAIGIFEEALARARERRGDRPAPHVLGMNGHYGYGAHTLFDDELRALGAVNVAAENGLDGYAVVVDEDVIRWQPDWIVATAQPSLHAAAVILVPPRVLLPASPLSAATLDVLGDALYGSRPR